MVQPSVTIDTTWSYRDAGAMHTRWFVCANLDGGSDLFALDSSHTNWLPLIKAAIDLRPAMGVDAPTSQ